MAPRSFKKKFLITVVAFAFTSVFFSGIASAEGPSDVSYDYELVYQLGIFDFRVTSFPEDSIWVLAEINPGPKSGRFEGIVTDPKTGNITPIPGTRPGRILDGSLKIVASLTGKPKKKAWDYKWKKTVTVAGDMIGTAVNDGHLPFWSHNFVICSLTNSRPDGNPVNVGEGFGPWAESGELYRVPADWKDFVVPGYEYFRDNRDLFEEEKVSQHKEQLGKLLENDNPFLAIAACRALARGRALDQERVETLLKGSTGLRQAVFAFVLFTNISLDPLQENLVAQMTDMEVKAFLIKYGIEEKNIPEPIVARAMTKNFMAHSKVPEAMSTFMKAATSVINASENSTQAGGIALGLGRASFVDNIEEFPNREKDIISLLSLLRKKLSTWGIKTETDKSLNSRLIIVLGAEKP